MAIIVQGILWFLIALPALILVLTFVAMAIGWSAHRRAIRIAAATPCSHCGVVLGREAVLKALQLVSAQIQEMKRKHPGVRFRRLMTIWEIVCPRCGRITHFDPSKKCVLGEAEWSRRTAVWPS